MNIAQLMRWQWQDYASRHRSRLNLFLHIIAVPLFWTGCLSLITGFAYGWRSLAFGIPQIVLSMIMQGIGHKQEALAPEPFGSPVNFLRRFCLEQWLTFPRFLLSGGWWRAWLDKATAR
jgi:uncharacterized membrane protein YGL010W